jgi:hypothetical protein
LTERRAESALANAASRVAQIAGWGNAAVDGLDAAINRRLKPQLGNSAIEKTKPSFAPRRRVEHAVGSPP